MVGRPTIHDWLWSTPKVVEGLPSPARRKRFIAPGHWYKPQGRWSHADSVFIAEYHCSSL
jgi:hypothetical protein